MSNDKGKVAKPVQGTARWIIKPGRAAAGVLAINRVPYLVTEHRDDGRTTGYRVQKEDGTSYDLDTSGKVWTCECRDYEYRRAGKDPKGCKHVAALRKALARLKD